VPADGPDRVTENGKAITDSEYVLYQGMEDGYVVYSVASGEYRFTVN
jgi:hypothetical protein